MGFKQMFISEFINLRNFCLVVDTELDLTYSYTILGEKIKLGRGLSYIRD